MGFSKIPFKNGQHRENGLQAKLANDLLRKSSLRLWKQMVINNGILQVVYFQLLFLILDVKNSHLKNGQHRENGLQAKLANHLRNC